MTIIASIHGRLGGDPETRTTQAGKEMVRASLAIDVCDGRDPEKQETLWVSVLAFGRVADALARASKGEMLTAMGRLTRGRFQGRDGQEREAWSLLADAVVTARSARPAGQGPSKGPSKPAGLGAGIDMAPEHRAAMRHQAHDAGGFFNDQIPFDRVGRGADGAI